MSSSETEVRSEEVKSEVVNVTATDFLESLKDRVSSHDARLILDSAIAGSGLTLKQDEQMTKDVLSLLSAVDQHFRSVPRSISRTNCINSP